MASLHSTKTNHRRLSAGESKEIAAAAASGERVTALAARFGVSRPTVYRAIERHRVGELSSRKGTSEARVTIRLAPYELAALDVLAGRLGISRAELARRILRRSADFLEADPELTEAVRDLTRQIKLIGGNLNQIAAHMNREARYQGAASLAAAQWKEIEGSERDLKALARRLDGLFLQGAKRRRARVADLIREVSQ